jgi:hypothetical protein
MALAPNVVTRTVGAAITTLSAYMTPNVVQAHRGRRVTTLVAPNVTFA